MPKTAVKDNKKSDKSKENDDKQLDINKEIIEKRKNEILGILLVAISILSAIALFTNTDGIVLQRLSEAFHYVIGQGAYLLPLLFMIWGITLIRLKGLKINTRLVGFILVYIAVMTTFHIYYYPHFPIRYAVIGRGGGIIAGGLSWSLLKLFGVIGSYVLLSTLILIGLLLWADVLLISILYKLKTYLFSILKKLKSRIIFFRVNNEKKKISTDDFEEDIIFEDNNDDIDEFGDELGDSDFNKIEEVYAEDGFSNELEEDLDINDNINSNSNINKEKLQEKKDKNNSQSETNNENGVPATYRLPGLNLLKDTSTKRKKPGNKSEILEETLQSFGVDARVIKVNHGPTITRYEVQPASGVKVSKIVSLADDIALALAAPGVRIEAPIPGKAAVGVEVPHMKNITVRLRDILTSREFRRSRGLLDLALGMGIDGKPIVTDLTSMPHLLVAGATGSGKSVCMNTIIASILYKAKPDQVKMLLIDPKKVELSSYQGLPHLFAPVVTDPKKAASVLKLVVDEMESRYELFSDSGTRGITSYNKNVSREERLPYIVVIIDELSDLMMVSASDVEDNICRLAQMARAAGIHLVIATQRPSVDVITGLIKANIPSRISFAVSSQTDSRTILDMGGAEKLMGKGDMLFAPTGTQKPQRIQGAFIDNNEISHVVDFVKNQANPDYEFNLDDIKEVKVEMDEDRDEYYEDAVKLVVQYRASISMLQRRLHIGHSRAARLIDMMEEDGIVGPYAGSKAREVLITEDELDEVLYPEEETEEVEKGEDQNEEQ